MASRVDMNSPFDKPVIFNIFCFVFNVKDAESKPYNFTVLSPYAFFLFIP